MENAKPIKPVSIGKLDKISRNFNLNYTILDLNNDRIGYFGNDKEKKNFVKTQKILEFFPPLIRKSYFNSGSFVDDVFTFVRLHGYNIVVSAVEPKHSLNQYLRFFYVSTPEEIKNHLKIAHKGKKIL